MTSIRRPPADSRTTTVTIPPMQRELLCVTALVTSSEVSRTAVSRLGCNSPSAFEMKDRASRTRSGRPGIVRLPRTAAPAITARSSVASLARVAVGGILAPPSRAAQKTARRPFTRHFVRLPDLVKCGSGSTLLSSHDEVRMHRTQVHSTNHGYEISGGISREAKNLCIVNGKQVQQAA